MKFDEFVTVKILKLKLLSNIIKHFVIDELEHKVEEQITILPLVQEMIETAASCKHWSTLVTTSE